MTRRSMWTGLALIVAAPPPAPAHALPKAVLSDRIAPAARPAAAVVDAFHAALKRGDTKAAAGMLAEDVLILESGGAERSKAEYSAAHLPADAEFAKATETTFVQRRGQAVGQFAWIASEGRSTGQFRGRPVNSRTAETMLLIRRGGDWTIAHIHWSSSPVR